MYVEYKVFSKFTHVLWGMVAIVVLATAFFPRAHIPWYREALAASAALVSSPFYYHFQVDGILEETSDKYNTSSPYWWLNSGARMYISGGTGKTVQGELPSLSMWRIIYFFSNPTDTDDGYHPQNLLRLVTRSMWRNFRQEVYFRILKDNMSASDNRNASNGVLLFNRYLDGNNLYYAGVRVDGGAVIKKKIRGNYYTIAYTHFFAGTSYDKFANPNLLPKNTWMGLRSEVINNPDGTVTIRLLIDRYKTGNWTLALETKDDGKSFGGAPILSEGYGGIRTDFMDVEFDDYKAMNL